MFFKRKPLYILFYLSVFILIFFSLTFVVATIRKKINSIEYRMVYFFEKKLKSKVEIGKVEGDLVREIIFKDVTIYNQFRDDKKLVYAKSVKVEFNLVKAVLKERIPIRNVKKITVSDFDLYLDEDLTQTQAVKMIMGDDDGVDDGPKKLLVDLVGGRVHSIFQQKKLGHFKAENVNVLISVSAKAKKIEGSGFVEGDEKVYFGTKTKFHIKLDDSDKAGIMKGMLNLDKANFMGYSFRGMALDMRLSPEKVELKVLPGNYQPFTKTLPLEYQESYNSKLPYDYLIDLSLTYLIDEKDLYIDVPVSQKSRAAQAIARSYLEKLDMADLVSKDFDWQIFGKVFFRFTRGGLTDFNIDVTRCNHIFRQDDNLSFQMSRKGFGTKGYQEDIILNSLSYRAYLGGTVKGSAVISPDKNIKKLLLKVDKLNIASYYPDKPVEAWNLIPQGKGEAIDLNRFSGKTSPLKKVNLKRDMISTDISLKNKDNEYSFVLENNKMGRFSMPDIQGKVLLDGELVNLELSGSKSMSYKVKAWGNKRKWDEIFIDAEIEKVDYSDFKGL
ncbi:MAG: hypothetical protein OEZ36_06440, partial [Spirochaetota bacterium]|nr:hypothetical protein [Spirochaetota bacterium]